MTDEYPPIDENGSQAEECARLREDRGRDRCLDPRCQRCYPGWLKESREVRS